MDTDRAGLPMLAFPDSAAWEDWLTARRPARHVAEDRESGE